MVENIIYSIRLNATWVKYHLVAINPSGIYHDYQLITFIIAKLKTRGLGALTIQKLIIGIHCNGSVFIYF